MPRAEQPMTTCPICQVPMQAGRLPRHLELPHRVACPLCSALCVPVSSSYGKHNLQRHLLLLHNYELAPLEDRTQRLITAIEKAPGERRAPIRLQLIKVRYQMWEQNQQYLITNGEDGREDGP